MLVEVKCEACKSKDLTYRNGKYEGFYCKNCDDMCEVEIVEPSNDKLDIVMSLVKANRNKMANTLMGEFCPAGTRENCEECNCDECWKIALSNAQSL